MDWKSDATGRSYTGTEGDNQAMVWRTSSREWAALVSHSHSAFAHTRCAALKDALVWCEARIIEASAKGQPTT